MNCTTNQLWYSYQSTEIAVGGTTRKNTCEQDSEYIGWKNPEGRIRRGRLRRKWSEALIWLFLYKLKEYQHNLFNLEHKNFLAEQITLSCSCINSTVCSCMRLICKPYVSYFPHPQKFGHFCVRTFGFGVLGSRLKRLKWGLMSKSLEFGS